MTNLHVYLGERERGTRFNRRAAVRYQCAPATPGKIIVPGDQEYQKAWVLDISLAGVGLQVVRPLPVGSFVALLLKSTDGKKTYELAAQVAHATLQPSGDWIVGCKLIQPLTQEDLDNLL